MKKLQLQRLLLLLLFSFSIQFSFSQNEDENKEEQSSETKEEESFNRHRLAVLFANAWIPAGSPQEGGSGFIVAPVYGFEYEFFITEKISVAANMDMEIMRYVINTGDHEDLEREFAVITTVVFGYELFKGFNVFLGPGREFEKHQSFWVLSTGAAYAFKLPKNFDISPTFTFEFKEAYSSFAFGFAFGKRFR